MARKRKGAPLVTVTGSDGAKAAEAVLNATLPDVLAHPDARALAAEVILTGEQPSVERMEAAVKEAVAHPVEFAPVTYESLVDNLRRFNPALAPLGDALRLAREQSGKTMGDVARTLGVSVVYVSDVERGRVLPDPATLSQFVHAVNPTQSAADVIAAQYEAAGGVAAHGPLVWDVTLFRDDDEAPDAKPCPILGCVLLNAHRDADHGDDHFDASGQWFNVGQVAPTYADEAEEDGDAVTFGPNEPTHLVHPDGRVEDLRPLADALGVPPIVVTDLQLPPSTLARRIYQGSTLVAEVPANVAGPAAVEEPDTGWETVPGTVEPPPLTTCCGTTLDAVIYNPFNRVVQCHGCGQAYEPKVEAQPSALPIRVDGFAGIAHDPASPNHSVIFSEPTLTGGALGPSLPGGPYYAARDIAPGETIGTMLLTGMSAKFEPADCLTTKKPLRWTRTDTASHAPNAIVSRIREGAWSVRVDDREIGVARSRWEGEGKVEAQRG